MAENCFCSYSSCSTRASCSCSICSCSSCSCSYDSFVFSLMFSLLCLSMLCLYPLSPLSPTSPSPLLIPAFRIFFLILRCGNTFFLRLFRLLTKTAEWGRTNSSIVLLMTAHKRLNERIGTQTKERKLFMSVRQHAESFSCAEICIHNRLSAV